MHEPCKNKCKSYFNLRKQPVMSWNVGQKLHRGKRFVELLDNKLGKFAQDVWGDGYVLGKDLYGGAWSETWLANRQGQKFVIKSLKHGIFNQS